MKTKNEYSFPLVIIAIVLGVTIFKQFDFATLKFENTALGVIYILTFLMTIYFLLKKRTKGE